MRQRCQACGVLSGSSAKFCQSCGAELTAKPEQPPSGLVGLPCPACGADTRAGAPFCTACGASLLGAQLRGGPPSSGPAPGQPVGEVLRSRRGRGRQGSRTGLWIGGGAAAVVAIAAGIALAVILLVGGDEGGDGVGGELDIVLQIIPRAVLLGQDQTTETLTLQAFHSNGDEIPIDTLAIEWMSGDSDIVSIVPDPVNAATATVTALNSIGTGMITARLRTDHSVVAPLVAVTRAKLHPGVDLVPDDIVIFPPPNLPDGMALSDFQISDFTSADQGSDAQFGGFSESELANLLEITDEFEVRYPIVLRGDPPEVGQRLLANEGSPIAGIVLSAEQKGNFSLVQLRVGTPQELFEELDFDISAEKLIEEGLLMPFDTSEWELDDSNPSNGKTGSTGSAGLLASPLAQSQSFQIASFVCTGRVRPTFTQFPTALDSYFGPIWDGSLKVRSYEVEHFYIKVGLQARAQFNPEIRLTNGVKVLLTCDTHPDNRVAIAIPVGGPIGVFLEPYIEGLISIPITGELSGGSTSRYGMKLGFNYAFWTGGTYTSKGGWKPLCESWDQCSRTNADAELILKHDTSGNQMTIEGDAALFGAAEAGIQWGGSIFRAVSNIPGLGRILSGAINTAFEKGGVPILRIRMGPKAIIRWHNPSRTAFFEASESAGRVVLAGDISFRFDAFNTYIRKALGLAGFRSYPIATFVEGDLVSPYRVLNEETLTVNGEKVSSGLFTTPVIVGVGNTVSVVSTVEREFREKTLIQLFFPSRKPHQDFPHLGEIWVDGQSIASMTPTNEFTLTGSFSVTQELCDKAKEAGEGSVEVKLLAFNRMFKAIPTPNFVGGFDLTCTDDLKVTVPISETLTDVNSSPQYAFEQREVTGDISSTAELTIFVDEPKEVLGWLSGEGTFQQKIGCGGPAYGTGFDDEATVRYELTYDAIVGGSIDPDNNFSIEIEPEVSIIATVIIPFTQHCTGVDPRSGGLTSDLGEGIISGSIVGRSVSLRTDWGFIQPLGGWHFKGSGQGVTQGK